MTDIQSILACDFTYQDSGPVRIHRFLDDLAMVHVMNKWNSSSLVLQRLLSSIEPWEASISASFIPSTTKRRMCSLKPQQTRHYSSACTSLVALYAMVNGYTEYAMLSATAPRSQSLAHNMDHCSAVTPVALLTPYLAFFPAWEPQAHCSGSLITFSMSSRTE